DPHEARAPASATAERQPGAVRRESERNGGFEPGVDFFASFHVPNAQGIVRAGGKMAAVARDGDTEGDLARGAECRHFFARGDVPETCLAAGRDEEGVPCEGDRLRAGRDRLTGG